MNLLIERKFDRVARRLEFRFRRIDRGNYDASAGIDNVLDKPQRMTFLFLCLSKKMLRELRQRLRSEMRSDRIILQLRAKLVSYLLIDRINHLLTGKHTDNLRE